MVTPTIQDVLAALAALDAALESEAAAHANTIETAQTFQDVLAAFLGTTPVEQGLIEQLRRSSESLQTAVTQNTGQAGVFAPEAPKRTVQMANPVLQQLADQVSATTTVEASAVTLINGFTARIDAAVQAAIANGATESELAPITDEVTAMKASAQSLADAVAANTPVAKKKP